MERIDPYLDDGLYKDRPYTITAPSVYRGSLAPYSREHSGPPSYHREMESLRDKQTKTPPSQQNAGEEKTFGKLMSKFMGYTTAHGVGRLGDAKTIFWKLFWTLVCLGAFGMFGYQLSGLFEQYLSKPVATQVRITFEKSLPFPAVTICNLNMLKKNSVPDSVMSQLREDLSYDEWTNWTPVYSTPSPYSGTTPPSGTGFEPARRKRESGGGSGSSGGGTTGGGTSGGGTSGSDSGYGGSMGGSGSEYGTDSYWGTRTTPRYSDYYYDDEYNYYNNDDDSYLDNYDDYGREDLEEEYVSVEQLDPETRLRINVAKIINEEDPYSLYQRGHGFFDMIKNCTWKGLDCKSGNLSQHWTLSWNYKYGNCFTWNSGKDPDMKDVRILSTSKPGPSQGLSLRLNIEQDQYIGPLTVEAGLRVLLHDQGVMPFPYEEGFSISPGMATSVGIKKTKISRLDRFDNNSCLAANELHAANIYRIYRNITVYSQQACLNSCLGSSQWIICGCAEAAYPSKAKPCDVFNSTIAKCLTYVKYLFTEDKLKCLGDCRQPCNEEVIQKTISSSSWPSKSYQSYMASKGVNKSESDNYLVLEVFYNELNYEIIEEKFSYGRINLLADIGGQLGLWIGISALTACELLELLMKMFSHLIKKCDNLSNGEGARVEPARGYR